VPSQRVVEPPRPRPAKAHAAKRPRKPSSYVLGFEARANPFERPKAERRAKATLSATAHGAKVKLLGLMNDSTGPMAAVEVDGKRRIVSVGTTLETAGGAGAVRVIAIRETDIVIGQGGRQWIAPLPGH
jgi:hypothetical protein